MCALTSSRILVPSVVVLPVKFTFINFSTCLDDDLELAGPAKRSHSEPRPGSSVTSFYAESIGRRLESAPPGGNISAEMPVRVSVAEAYQQLQKLLRDSKDGSLNVGKADSDARGIAESSPQTRIPVSSGTQKNMVSDRSEDDLDWMAIQDLPQHSWSVGSSKHADGKCKPCAWNWKPNGCSKAESCEFCHMCGKGMVKTRKVLSDGALPMHSKRVVCETGQCLLPGNPELWAPREFARSRKSRQHNAIPNTPEVSTGSVGHPVCCAEPCKYVKKKRGCKDGAKCDRCHLCVWTASKQVDITTARRDSMKRTQNAPETDTELDAEPC